MPLICLVLGRALARERDSRRIWNHAQRGPLGLIALQHFSGFSESSCTPTLDASMTSHGSTARLVKPRLGAVDGVRLHYDERGKGEPLVLLHGNGSMIQ